MKFDPCYEYFQQYKQACDAWISATQALTAFQGEHLCPSKQWQDVHYATLKGLADTESQAKADYFDALHAWMDCKEGKL